MRKILIVEEPQIRRFLRDGYEQGGFSVIEAESAATALRLAAMSSPDLVILNSDLSDLDAAEVIEGLRSWSNVPVIILSVKADEPEKVRLLKAGADDYVVKPFGISELLARSEATLRREIRSANREPVVKAGPLSIDLVSRMVTLDGRRLQLTRKEYALLHGLAAHAGFVVTHQQLIGDIWNNDVGNVQYLRILVRKLRQKIETEPTHPQLIISESGIGYRLERGIPAKPEEQHRSSSNAACVT
jgi:two-component system, OmpR family, KDP operon response regulator KdpE